jgi:peptide/nickel transport system substrate-binding protein
MAEAGGADGFEAGAILESQDLRVNEILRDQLSRIGIKVNLETLDTGLYVKRVNELKQFDINLNGSVVDPDPDDSIWNFFHSEGPWNGLHYKNPKADELLVAQRAEMDQEKRAKILWELEDLLNADNAVIWAYHKNDTPGFRKEVQGFVHVPELRPLHTVYIA